MKKAIIASIAFFCVVVSTLVSAQAFPSRTVRIQVPYAAGTGPEVLTRILAEKLAGTWNKPVVVEAKPGASGFIAIETVKNSAPDGHELLIAANGHMAINPALYKKLPYDPQKDLTPLAMVYKTPHFVAVSASGPYQSVPSLLAAARANPGRLSYGSAYIGSPGHLGSAELEMLTGTQMIHVPFKDQNQAFVSIANGELTWMFSTLASATPMVKAGRIKLLAIVGKQRLASQPDIPTLAEVGGPAALEVVAWIALFARHGTPQEVVQKINADVNKQLTTPDVVERMRNSGWEAAPATPADLAALIRADTKKYAELVRRTGASAD
jgi:tripartite-type tricarboxylate transporter receptor subunit TctC